MAYNIPNAGVGGHLAHTQAVADAINNLDAFGVRGVLVVTGSEARPDAAIVLWIDPDEIGPSNAISTDPVIVITP